MVFICHLFQLINSNLNSEQKRRKLFLFIKHTLSVFTSTAFDQNYPAPEETSTRGYTLLDLSIGGNFKIENQMMSFSLSGNNLFDRKYIDHLSTLKEVGLFNPGRNIILSLKIPFIVKSHKANKPTE